MPPRFTKRGGPGYKRPMRGPVVKPDEQVEVKKVEDEIPPIVIDENESEPEEEPIEQEQEPIEQEQEPIEQEQEPIEHVTKDDNAKEPVHEYEKDERLDLEDNDTEYEPEEDGGADFSEKETEQDPQYDGDQVEEEPEEEADFDEEEETDMVEEEPEEDNHVGEERAGMVDVAEEEEHHEVVKERRKRKEFEIFVGGLDKDATENDLKKVFGEVGEITEVRLMMNPQTKKNKGFAFLRFATVEQAKHACTQLKNPVVNGKQCGVSPSQDSDTLFIGNISKTWTREALKDKLKHYGIDNIEDLTLVEDTENVGKNRGFAFIEFSSRSEAMDAFKRLQKRDVLFGSGRPAKVSFADSFVDPGDEIMAQVKTVFLDGLSASWDEDYLKKLLKSYGEIEKVELARNMPSARRKDFGFVTFDTHEAAVTCAKCINNEELGEGDNKSKVRARLSRPLQRAKGKHIPRGDYQPGRVSGRGGARSYGRGRGRGRGRPPPRSVPLKGPRGVGPRIPPVPDRMFRRPVTVRDKRPPLMAPPPRSRPVAPVSRSYDRRPPVPAYPKSSLKRDYGHREPILPSRSRAGVVEYDSRAPPERRPSYARDDYAPRGSGNLDMSRGGTSSYSMARRDYVDDGYSQRYERPPPTYREGGRREYDSMAGSKRPYTAMDDVPPRYAEAGVRQSRPRLDYDIDRSTSHYGDAYGDRFERSNLGYGSGSRSSMSSQDSHGMYSSRQGMAYSGGLYGGSDGGGAYSPGFGGDYISRGSDIGGNSYSSSYSRRGLGGGNSYMGSSSSGSYY